MNKGRTFALSDLHGEYNLWKQIKDYLKPNDTLYYLGDAADRGPDGWKLIKELYNDSRVIYLKGNHEDMLVKAIREYIKYDGMTGKAYYHLCNNGGERTFNDWYVDGAYSEWAKILDNLPYYTTYRNEKNILVHLCHAGLTPWDSDPLFVDEYKCLWDRDHYLEEPEEDELNGVSVYGHTPIIYIADDLHIRELEPGALWHCNNHKIAIDCGACVTGMTTLLDLDTFDEHIFSY
jgi:hypothetical protein